MRNATQIFQRYLNQVLGDLYFVTTYIDDILIVSSNLEEHLRHLRIVFERIADESLHLNLAKCIFGVAEIVFKPYD